MTTLRKRVRRETLLPVGPIRRDVPVIVTLYPGGLIGFRHKRSRQEYQLDLQSAYVLAVQKHNRVKDAERQAKRKEKRA